MIKEKTIMAFQANGIRLQMTVKNNKIYLIENRRIKRYVWDYNKDRPLSENIGHAFFQIAKIYWLNEEIWRIKEDGTYVE